MWEKEEQALKDILVVTNHWLAMGNKDPSIEQLSNAVQLLTDAVNNHAPLLVEQLAMYDAASPVLLDSLVATQRAADAAANGLKHSKARRMASAIDQRIAANMLEVGTEARLQALRAAPKLKTLQSLIDNLTNPDSTVPDMKLNQTQVLDSMDDMLGSQEQVQDAVVREALDLQKNVGLLAQSRVMHRYSRVLGVGGQRGRHSVREPCTVLHGLDTLLTTLQVSLHIACLFQPAIDCSDSGPVDSCNHQPCSAAQVRQPST